MVKTLVAIFAVFALLSKPSHANAQALWGGTQYGMTLDEVKKVVPNAKPCAEGGNRLGDGALGLLCERHVPIIHEMFKASFYFKNKSLTQVTLSLEGTNSFYVVKLVFDSIADVLRSKYGHELSLRSQTGTLNEATADWISGHTNINLFGLSVYNAPATLNINYQINVSQDAGKL